MATKYVSALDGQQMDAALTDMAYHNSEAWAVGTRDGQAVSASDVTYHNNAKYYSDKVSTDTQRAEDAAARAEAAVPAGTAGAVFFNTAQSLTTAQQMQAKANISAGSTNPNLLDNPWFTVNQRSLSTYSTNAYSVDRWKVNASTTLTVGTTGVTLSAGGGFRQYLPLSQILDGKTYTFSAMTADGSVYSMTGTLNSSASGWQINAHLLQNYIWCGIRVDSGKWDIDITSTNGVTIKATKLELGSVSTLANDTPPNYAEELRKCQYYYREFSATGTAAVGIAWAYSATAATHTIFGVANTMRVSPTVTLNGSFSVQVQGGSLIAVTSVSKATETNSVLNLNFQVASGLTANQSCRIIASAGAKITFSADL